MNIHLIIPITGIDDSSIAKRIEFLRSIAKSNTSLSYSQVKQGPPAIESPVDHTLGAAEVLNLVKPAENAGANAIIIWCAGDPGLEAARTLVDIPVIGPGESMKLLVNLLGKNPAAVPAPLPVLELRKDLENTFKLTKRLIELLVEKGHDSFYLDCLGMFGMGKQLREATGYPVIDPAESSLKIAEIMADLHLTHSRIAYPKFPPSHRL